MRRGFTLIEVLVVVAIIALLSAILLPSMAGARAEGKRAVCLGNLKQLSIATAMYLDDNRDHFWRYFERAPLDPGEPKEGRLWWFGYEPNGPAFGIPHRPLDKTKGRLARYLRSTDDGLQCPAFPYASGCYYPKFAARSASYGYNVRFGPANKSLPVHRPADYGNRLAGVFVFADGAHWDFSDETMNEGFYIQYRDLSANVMMRGGYAHFRHRRRAQVLYLDGHAEGQRLRGPAFGGASCGDKAGNLTDPAGGRSIYGFVD